FNIKKWKMEVDVTHAGWDGAFDEIDVNYEKNTAALADQSLLLNWDAAWTYRLGAALPVGKNYELRAGFAWDTDPVPDETVNPVFPEGERYSFQAGYGFQAPSGKFRYDAYLRWADQDHQEAVTAPLGTYDGNEVTVGLAGTWTF